MAGYKLISSTTVGSSGAASITFSNIPSTYTDLILLTSLRDDSSGALARTVNLTFNGSSSSYAYKMIEATGSTIANGTSSSATSYPAGVSVGPTATANIFTNTLTYISNYAGSYYKSMSTDDAMENNASSLYNHLTAGLWSNTAAITSITLVNDNASNFVQYSTAYLYGIKNS